MRETFKGLTLAGYAQILDDSAFVFSDAPASH